VSTEIAAAETDEAESSMADASVAPDDWIQVQTALAMAQEQRAKTQQSLEELKQQQSDALKQKDSDQRRLTQLQQMLAAEERRGTNQSDAKIIHDQQLSDLQVQQTSLEKQLEQLQQATHQAAAEQTAAESLAAAGERLVGQRQSALQALRDLSLHEREQHSDTGVAETIVDFSNSSGTSRTPIVVDITPDGFVFPATQIRVRRRDMEGSSSVDNPLLSGVLATHRQRSNDSVAMRPYVLLLVRPGGTLDFYVAQRVLREAHIHFGYELLTEDTVIAAAEPVDGELEAVRDAILNSILRRERYVVEGSAVIRQRIAILKENERRARESSFGNSPDPSEPRDRTIPESNGYAQSAPNDSFDTNAEERFSEFMNPNAATDRFDGRNSTQNDNTEAPRSYVSSEEPPNEAAASTDEWQSIPSIADTGRRVEEALAKAIADREQSRLSDSSEGSGSATISSSSPGQPHTMELQPLDEFGHRLSSVPPAEQIEDSEHVDEFWAAMRPLETNPLHESTASQESVEHQSDEPVRFQTLDGQTYLPHDRSPEAASRKSSSGGSNGTVSTPSGKGGGGFGAGSRSASGLTSYRQITIYLDPQHYTIVGQDPVALHGQSISRITDTLVNRLFEISSRNPHSLADVTLPATKFIVSPGAHTLYLQLAAELHDMNIPVSSVVSMDAHATSHPDEFSSVMRSVMSKSARTVSGRKELP